MLPEKTQRLFDHIKRQPDIGNFVLVGGTALALQLGHRYSEDLDFLTTSRIDQKSVNNIMRSLDAAGARITMHAGFDALLEFDGDRLEDYSLRFSVDGIKLDFFCKQIYRGGRKYDVDAVIETVPPPDIDAGYCRIASENCIFALKSQVLDERVALRDLYDLRVMLGRNNRMIRDLFQAAEQLGASAKTIKYRLLHEKRRREDPIIERPPGAYDTIPDTFDQLRAWFANEIDEMEREEVRQRVQQAGPP